MALAIEALEGRQFLSEAVGPGPEVVALFQARRSGDPPQVGGDGRIRKAPHFYELYTGPRRPGLNVVEARGLFRNGRRFLLTGTMQGRIDRREPALYVFGINRGGARAGPFPNRPDIRFDAVVVVSVGPSGVGGSVSDLATGTTTDLPTQAVRVAGRRMRAVVDADLLPSTGLPPRCYRFNLWPRTGPGGPEKIASFAPESTTLRVGLPRPHRRSHPCPPVAAPPTPPPPVEPPTPPPVEPPTQPPVEPPIQPPSVPAPQVIAQAITVTNLREPDGTPANQSRVVVPFTQEINVADASRLTLAGTAINPVAPSPPVTVAIPILSAAKDPADPRNLVLTTGVLVPQGASLTIGAGALTGAAGQVMEGQSVAVPQGVGIVDFTMANRAFKPTDINLFGGDAFTTASFAPNAPGTGADEATTRSQLDAFLGRKVSLGLITDAQRADALARYDSAATKAIIPDPSLRAGLFSLLGTVAGGAVDAVLTGNNQTGRPFSSVDYDPTVTGVGVALTDAPPGEPVRIRFNPRYRGESFQALGAIIVHEVGHQDSRPVNGVNLANSRNEEVLLDSARAIAWAQSLLVDPSLAAQNTFLVRSNNTVLLALLNSGNIASPSVGLGEAPQVLTGATAPTPRVFVGGSEFYRSFDNYIRTQAAFGGIPEADTSGNLYLDSLLSAIIGSPVTGRDFSLATIAFVDQDQRALSNEQAVTLAGILRLTLPAAPPIAPSVFTQGIAVANEREPDGTPANRSRLVVPFTQAVNLVDAGRLTLTGTAIDPANPSATRSVSIPILSAVRDTSDPRNLVLTTGVLVPRGTQLAIGAGAVTGASTSLPSATQTVTIPQGVGQVDANRAFRPTDVNLFGRDAFTTASFAPDAPGTGADEATTRSLLDAFLGRKVSLGLITDAQRADALARYDSAATKAIIPDPSLRAGLFSLLGTVAGGAVDAVLTSNNQTGRPYVSVDYDPSIQGGLTAAAFLLPDGSFRVRFNPRYRGESFQALGAVIAHEVGHQDGTNSRNEEVLDETARAYAWAQNLLVDPDLAAQNTALVRNNNTAVLALLNSGDAGYPRVGLRGAPQVQTGGAPAPSQVFVGGSEFYPSFDNYVRTQAAITGISEGNTPGNPYLDSLLSAITGSPVTGRDFSLATIAFVDQSQRAISNEQALALATILKLTLP